ncbi:MAG: 3-oxoacyl-[acyl-carrier-protein] reductase [Hornefia sp.]|nr:3-oxoacyl-[acyl-carrier-protein] reductase [Hornefia sp.]
MDREVAIITGGSRGIGRAVAIAMAKRGRDVVINYSGNEEAAKDTAKECMKSGVKAVVVQGDVAAHEDCVKILDRAVNEFGRVDILVNNAGITKDNLMMRMSAEDFDSVLNTNLRGPFILMKLTSKIMMKQRYGRIINMASVSGILGNIGQANYAASKAGIIGLTKTAARELASRNITVNAVAPGFIETDMTRAMGQKILDEMCSQIPVKRQGQAEEVANAVAFFADKENGYVTGQVLCVDGGMCM